MGYLRAGDSQCKCFSESERSTRMGNRVHTIYHLKASWSLKSLGSFLFFSSLSLIIISHSQGDAASSDCGALLRFVSATLPLVLTVTRSSSLQLSIIAGIHSAISYYRERRYEALGVYLCFSVRSSLQRRVLLERDILQRAVAPGQGQGRVSPRQSHRLSMINFNPPLRRNFGNP